MKTIITIILLIIAINLVGQEKKFDELVFKPKLDTKSILQLWMLMDFYIKECEPYNDSVWFGIDHSKFDTLLHVFDYDTVIELRPKIKYKKIISYKKEPPDIVGFYEWLKLNLLIDYE